VGRPLLVALVVLAVVPAAAAHGGKGFRAAEVPQVKARFEAYLEATVEKRMFVRDVPIICKGRERMAGNRFRHIRCTATYGAQLDNRVICRQYHRTSAGRIVSGACPKR
jgi:hypothetical protein